MKKQEQNEAPVDITIELVAEAEQEFSLADYLPEDHQMNDPACTCAACSYPLN